MQLVHFTRCQLHVLSGICDLVDRKNGLIALVGLYALGMYEKARHHPLFSPQVHPHSLFASGNHSKCDDL